ncbi:MAG: hypothetical protein E6G14_15355 [Actinobacteria bacterium]|nr:MAG: hypothetical protein E6G60_00280 [Actinomycetota bacterium]TML66146.1 MAG: hypothetical protein E6G14_15355 [Actinomycetota bacterium]
MSPPLPPTTAVADVLHIVGGGGVLSPPLRAFTPVAETIRGGAATVLLAPADEEAGPMDMLYERLDADLSGAVVVLAGAADVAGAVWGQILSRAAARSGAVAAAVDGCIRDRPLLPPEGLAVFGRSEATVGAIGLVRVVAVDVPVRVGATDVHPGDSVLVDDGGVVALERGRADEILECAREYADAEDALLDDLARGVRLVEAYNHKRNAVRRIRERTAG